MEGRMEDNEEVGGPGLAIKGTEVKCTFYLCRYNFDDLCTCSDIHIGSTMLGPVCFTRNITVDPHMGEDEWYPDLF
jgi:hypothetical protein